MVQYAVVATGEPHTIVGSTVAQAHTHEADDHVLAREPDGGALDGNTLAGSRLPRNRHVILIADQARFQLDHARHLEYDGTWANFCRARLAQGTRTVIVQVRHVHHLATAATQGVAAITFGTLERDAARLERPDIPCRDRSVRIDFIDAPVVCLERSRAAHLIRTAGLFTHVNRSARGRCRKHSRRIRPEIDAMLYGRLRRTPRKRQRSVFVRNVIIQIRRRRPCRLCRRIGHVQFKAVQGNRARIQLYRGRGTRTAYIKSHVGNRRLACRERTIRGLDRRLLRVVHIDIDAVAYRRSIDIVQVQKEAVRPCRKIREGERNRPAAFDHHAVAHKARIARGLHPGLVPVGLEVRASGDIHLHARKRRVFRSDTRNHPGHVIRFRNLARIAAAHVKIDLDDGRCGKGKRRREAQYANRVQTSHT